MRTASATWHAWPSVSSRRRQAWPALGSCRADRAASSRSRCSPWTAHEKRGRYVGSHLHLNVTYLAVASPEEPLRVKPDENSGVRWVDLDDVCTVSTEPWIADRIYRKLIEKLAGIAL